MYLHPDYWCYLGNMIFLHLVIGFILQKKCGGKGEIFVESLDREKWKFVNVNKNSYMKKHLFDLFLFNLYLNLICQKYNNSVSYCYLAVKNWRRNNKSNTAISKQGRTVTYFTPKYIMKMKYIKRLTAHPPWTHLCRCQWDIYSR